MRNLQANIISGHSTWLFLLFLAILCACAGEKRVCDGPTKGDFSKADLVGTWKTIESDKDNIIIINDNGNYKQRIQEKATDFTYESEWQPWRVTCNEKGLPYLHLSGFLMCAYWDQIDCSGNTHLTPVTIGDSRDPFSGQFYWYDSCLEQWVETADEAVFFIFVYSQPKAFGRIYLVPLTKSTEGTTGPTFYLEKS